MEQVEAAAAAIGGSSPALEAAVELMRAELLYRSEIDGREFPAATVQAHRAVQAHRRLRDWHGEAEGVHLLGLIHLQRRELPAARTLFDRSLALDRAAGERPFFRGEYERHIGFVELFEGDTTAAIPHFERSLALRRQVGATDASLFAATTLAATLLGLGRTEAARPHVLYAMTAAAGLDTPFGRAQLCLVAGRLHAQTGDHDAASRSFETALALGDSIGAQAIVQQARTGMKRLHSTRP
jgi:tetratricopeptide (TPR) repeat protein